MTTETHAHHWMIDPAFEGKPSRGACIHCEEVREFKNSLDYDQSSAWRDSVLSHPKGGRRKAGSNG